LILSPQDQAEHLYGLFRGDLSVWFIEKVAQFCSVSAPISLLANSGTGGEQLFGEEFDGLRLRDSDSMAYAKFAMYGYWRMLLVSAMFFWLEIWSSAT
jgi:hypothetical protein